jgi:CheY-like chemotaxis protein
MRNIVELHGGAVVSESEGLGRGSRFTARIPLGKAQSAAMLPAPGATEGPWALRLLLSDDNVYALRGMAQMLVMAGFTVESVHNGGDALRMARQPCPGAALLDIGMRGLDGHKGARRIRAERWGLDMFIVTATGWGQPDDTAAAVAIDFDEHLIKPAAPRSAARAARLPGQASAGPSATRARQHCHRTFSCPYFSCSTSARTAASSPCCSMPRGRNWPWKLKTKTCPGPEPSTSRRPTDTCCSKPV